MARELFHLLFAWREATPVRAGAAVILVGLIVAATTLLIYRTGGTHLVYVHLIYVPIVIGAFFFGFVGGVTVGFVAGLCLGPWMPLDVAQAIPQSTFNWAARTGFLMLSGGVAGLLAASLAQQIEKVRRHAHYDPVTGLPNRARLLEDLDALIAGGRDAASPIVLLAIGLSHFDTVLATLGHRHADALLRAAAGCLRGQLPDGHALYDLGGGSFVVPLAGSGYETATELTHRLRHALHEPFEIEGVPVLAGGRYGVAQYPADGNGSLAVLRAAIAALRESVRLGLPYAIYDDGSDRARRDTARLLPDLHSALRKDGELALHYQPKVRLDTGECTGVEALIRWHHPERGMVPPAQFISLAEQTALIGPLTEWVVGAALCQLADWKRDGIELSIAINVSAHNLEDAGFPALIADRLRLHGVEPSRLQIEVTESAFMAAPEIAIRTLTAIRHLGVSVALDDFGTGQSSLSYLRDLPADDIKLDQSFLRNLLTDHKTQLIVRSTIETAHQLGFRVVGEGIEDGPSYACLQDLSCDMGQGYHVCRPLPEPELRAWLNSATRQTPPRPAQAGLTQPGLMLPDLNLPHAS